MSRFYSHAHINPATMDEADDKHIAWLDGLRADQPAAYAELAHTFFARHKSADAFQDFLRWTANDYELATGSRDDE